MSAELYIAHSGEFNIWRVPLDGSGAVKIPVASFAQHDVLACGNGWICACAAEGLVARGEGSFSFSAPVGAGACALARSGRSVFVTCCDSDSVWKLDAYSGSQKACVHTGCYPVDICTVGSSVFVANLLSADICVFDLRLNYKKKVHFGGMPLCVERFGLLAIACALTSEEQGVCAGMTQAGSIAWKWRTAPFTALKAVSNSLMAAVCAWEDRIMLVDMDQKEFVWSAKTGKMPEGLEVDPGEKRIYVSCLREKSVQVFDFGGSLIGEIEAGKEPCALALARNSRSFGRQALL